MAIYGTPGSGSPDDDPYGPPPVDPTLPQWGPPPGPYPATGQPSAFPPPGPYPPVGQPAPAEPWGPSAPAPGYGPGPVAPPTKRGGRRIGLIIALVVVLLLCPCLGLAGWGAWKAVDNKGDTSAGPTFSTPAAPTDEPSGKSTDKPTTAPTTVKPTPTKNGGKGLAKGNCVVNDGTDTDADLRKVPCGPDTYEILLRIPSSSNGNRCKTAAPRSTANYVYDHPQDSLDYVLCLRKRTS
ncbi:hypothetical protein [Micromonospora sp. RTGN7]|uniref:LppU/SCO3897 family protein n=1 Tax=Micromonospora sp. RTGN7 TaxID=3016526 RepID=UPI0029FEF55E|nr:hypothetical protein [Micromonospora sp. RTGN7]